MKRRQKSTASIFLFILIFVMSLSVSSHSFGLTTSFEAVGNYRVYAKGVGLNNPSDNATTGNIQLNITGTPHGLHFYNLIILSFMAHKLYKSAQI